MDQKKRVQFIYDYTRIKDAHQVLDEQKYKAPYVI